MSKKILFVLAVISLVGLTTGCGKKAEAVAESGATKIVVSTTDQFPKIAFLDDDDNLTGYDIEVLRAIDEKLTDYEFEYTTSTDPMSLLQTGKAQLSACQWEYSDERAETYLFPKEGYGRYDTYITVDANRDDINGIDDLQGKTVQEYLGGNAGAVLQKYNESHQDNPIELILIDSSPTLEERIASIQSGKWDAFCITQRDCDDYNVQAGETVFKQVGEAVTSSETYFVLAKGNEALADQLDKALQELKSEGVLTDLSIKFLGGDYSGSK